MDLTIPAEALSELAAAFLLGAVTLGLAGLCAFLYRRYRKPYFGYWAVAWFLFALRLAAIISFIVSANRHWLYWHQVVTGWTALALLWAAVSFSQQLPWRKRYLWFLAFPPLWSYMAIYRLDNFFLAAGPAVLFLSVATLWTGWVFLLHYRRAKSVAAASLALTLLLWGLHHLDYPFLRARGVWNPWGYYLDLMFVLAMGAGILLLVVEDQHRGLATLSALSADLQRIGRNKGGDVLAPLLERPLTLPGVRGAAMYLIENGHGRFVRGSGVCAAWTGSEPTGAAGCAIARCVAGGQPEMVRDWPSDRLANGQSYAYAVALPVLEGPSVSGAMLIVGDARDPFAALDTRFLVALGQQVGAALESADLYRRIEARTEELEWLASRMVQQHEEERRRLSRELHDETAQVFSAVKLQLALLREKVEHDSADRLDRVLGLVDAGIKSIRDVTNDLRPSLLDDLGLVPALRALVDDFSERSGLLARMTPAAVAGLSDDAELALFRALQEGLSNVARHAAASSVVVSLAVADDTVVLRVRDDGRGPPHHDWQHLERKGHMGLAGMRERITSLGGYVSIDDAQGQGFELVVGLPVPSGRAQ
jgi:signal transduction histidine kinase